MGQEAIKEAINVLEEELAVIMVEVRKKQQAINVLYESLGENPKYEIEGDTQKIKIKRSQFYGKTFVGAVREFLEFKNEPCTPEEIYQGLEDGAFAFQWKKKDRLRSVAISLSKNPATFHKLPNGTVGLSVWYEDIKKKKSDEKSNGDKLKSIEDSNQKEINQVKIINLDENNEKEIIF